MLPTDKNARVWLFLAVLLCVLAGCTLLLPYEGTRPESSDAECHDGIDNDFDRAIDCDDDSCVHCVGRPRLTCPEGWISTPVTGASIEVSTCVLPDTVFDEIGRAHV